LETATGKEIIQITFEGYMNSVAFSPDGKHMVLEKGDGTAQVWEAATGKEIARITHTSAVGTIVFSPDGKYVVSEFGDGSARVWELLTGKEIAYTRHAGSVSAVAFSPNGKYVVSGGCIESNMVGCTKSSVRVWLWQPEDIIVNVCAYLPRNLTRAEWAQFIGDAMPYQAVCENLPIESEFTTTPTATP
jgi:WD40 repeat protein